MEKQFKYINKYGCPRTMTVTLEKEGDYYPVVIKSDGEWLPTNAYFSGVISDDLYTRDEINEILKRYGVKERI